MFAKSTDNSANHGGTARCGPRTVVISEPHPYTPFLRYGAHQYAKVFARHGWKVVLLSASFNLWRIFLASPGIDQEYLALWRERGRLVQPNLINYCLAHILPTQFRFREPFSRIAHKLYSPSIRSILNTQNIQCADLLWLNGDRDWLLRKAIPHSKLLVRIIDYYSGFNSRYDNYHPMLQETLRCADGVFTCSERVKELYTGLAENIKVVPNGVDFEHFVSPVEEEPDVLRCISRPRIVYVGSIAEWFDFDLIVELARRLPDYNFIIFGQWSRKQPIEGSYPGNIYILGPIEYSTVPAVLAYSDVGLIPFRDTELVRGVSPIKVYEYLAARLPVVSLHWSELEHEKLPILLASNVDEFENQIQAALAMSEEQRNAFRVAVQQCSWEHRLLSILEVIGLPLDAEQ